MKSMKKFASILLALVLAMALTVPAFAAGDGSVTVEDARGGQTYNLYKIFDLADNYVAPTDGNNGRYSYYIDTNSDWYGILTYSGVSAYVEPDNDNPIKNAAGEITGYYVSWVGEVSDTRAAEFAKLAMAYLEAHTNITPVKTETPAATEENPTVTFTGLGYGYYLLDSSAGTVCSLSTVTPNVKIKEKNAEPGLDKEVKEGQSWGESNNAQIGDTVEFRATITAKKGAVNYIMHDTMGKGLEFDPETNTIEVFTSANKAEDTEVTNVAVDATYVKGDNCTFDVKFNDSWLKEKTDALSESESFTFYVFYTATLGNDAVIATNPNENEAHLTYGDNNKTTKEEKTNTYTYAFDLVKYDGSATTKNLLDGAEFTLTRKTTVTLPTGATEEQLTDVKFLLSAGTYKVNTTDAATTTIAVSDGKVELAGLDAGTYILTETKAPDGYNKLTTPIEIVIEATDNTTPTQITTLANATVKVEGGEAGTLSATVTNGVYENGGIGVENQTGAQMPSTGGIGTTIFYTLGGLLVVAAGIMLVTKRRMQAQA